MTTRSDNSRRTFLSTAVGGAFAVAAAQGQQKPPSPDATVRDWAHPETVRYPEPDVIALDNRFRKYMVGNGIMKRVSTGTLWAEGPAWSGVGRYLVWSDI